MPGARQAIKRHLTYANVVATLLLFVVLGGTAWALAKNSVGSRQIKPGAVKRSDLAANAVRGRNVVGGSLRSADLAAGTAGAVAIEEKATSDTAAPLEILSSRGLVLSMSCIVLPSTVGTGLHASGPVGTQLNFSGIEDATFEVVPFISGLNLNETAQAVESASDGGESTRVTYINGVYRSATSTVSFEVALTALAGDSPLCRARGHAIPTPATGGGS